MLDQGHGPSWVLEARHTHGIPTVEGHTECPLDRDSSHRMGCNGSIDDCCVVRIGGMEIVDEVGVFVHACGLVTLHFNSQVSNLLLHIFPDGVKPCKHPLHTYVMFFHSKRELQVAYQAFLVFSKIQLKS